MKRYVAGFLFSSHMTNVAMIMKKRPEWQKGKLNGIGGHIERKTQNHTCYDIVCDVGGFDPCKCPYETPLEAMVREFEEEAGVHVPAEQWEQFLALSGDGFEVNFFSAADTKLLNQVRSMTDETVMVVEVDKLPLMNTISNIPWVVQMALNARRGRWKFTVQEEKVAA